MAASTGLAPARTRLKVSPHDYLAFEAEKWLLAVDSHHDLSV